MHTHSPIIALSFPACIITLPCPLIFNRLTAAILLKNGAKESTNHIAIYSQFPSKIPRCACLG